MVGPALALLAGAAAVVAIVLVLSERASRTYAAQREQRQIAALSHQVAGLQQASSTLAGKLAATRKQMSSAVAGDAPLAARVLRSVFTVETTYGLGTGWVAWTDGNYSYLITANHVAQDAIDFGTHQVKLQQKGRTWHGTIIRSDSTNDLAVVRVHGTLAPALWQTPDDSISPEAGDRLLLVGSPYGLEGTVTDGIVSRVTYDEIQTDAAANPGNSGGPAVDRNGNVVGVLLSGGGENLNFLVPIQRACVNVRRC